jgi:multisubunit Na+/H+ antiporter MnhF subunit
MDKEDLAMIELLIFAIGYAVLAMVVCIRLVKGPSGIDRAVASDCVDTLTTVSLALFAVFSGRSIYLDISMTLAVLGFLGTVMIARYMEGKL